MSPKKPACALKLDIVTLFPKMFNGPFQESLLAKAQAKGLIEIRIHDLRDFTTDKHRKVDAKPFGGGAGMVIQVEPLYRAIQKLTKNFKKRSLQKPWVVYLSPQGKKLEHEKVLALSQKKHLVLLCGHYEGIDERAMEWIDEEISIGDFVLTGGEIPAMALTDAVCRLVPGVVKEWDSISHDSFFHRILDHAHYTRPEVFKKRAVPKVLLSGNHQAIQQWREESSLHNTKTKRPDLREEPKHEL